MLAGDNDMAAVRCAVLLNAAAGLYVSGGGWTFEEAVERAARERAASAVSGEGRRRLLHPGAQPRERRGEPFLPERLDEVVEGPELERRYGIARIGFGRVA